MENIGSFGKIRFIIKLGEKMIWNLLSFEYWRDMLYVASAALVAISVHEASHGIVSYKMGDPTPKRDGRLTLNPFVHLDLWGTLCLIFFHL